jgi:uncharacterized damage-inducible protein DinB
MFRHMRRGYARADAVTGRSMGDGRRVPAPSLTTVDPKDVLTELYGRIPDLVRQAVDGLDAEQLTTAPAAGANTIGWLVWHLTRVEDHHVSELLREEQLWTSGDWSALFGRHADPHDTGYGHTAAQVAAVHPDSAQALVDYHDAVAARTRRFLDGIAADDLDVVVDERWDPPVTLGVRLVSVADDALQHAGQAAYVRGFLLARS